MNVEALIAEYRLAPHPEGGWYRETWRAAQCLPGTQRSVGTAIFFLLPSGARSRLHRIDADEVWHFYRGDPLVVVELQPGAPAKQTVVSAQHPQHVVPAGTWFGAMPAPGSAFSLVGCTVAPAFEFSAFELGSRDALLTAFPHARDLVLELT